MFAKWMHKTIKISLSPVSLAFSFIASSCPHSGSLFKKEKESTVFMVCVLTT